jgi:nucleoside-diphosphate-sugar epimerase
MQVAVTGASGFVGGHLLAELARRGCQVVATSRSGQPPAGAASPAHWVALDLHAPSATDFERLGRPEVLVHLAWSGLPNYRSLHHFETELPAQYAFLAGLVRQGLRSLVVVGTCFEYGMQSGPLEASRETRPANPYGFAKDSLRRQLQFLQAREPFRLGWARLFYLYGAGQASGSLYPLLQQAVARGDRQFPMSGGEQLRDYLPVAEVARQLADLAAAAAGPGTEPGVVNVCSGRPVSVRTLVEGWIQDHGWSIEPQLGRFPYPDYEPMAFWGVAPPPVAGDGHG